ncbi:MAG TPA: Clp protease N-terminal domain-containing protein, partial [Anaerolineae bacterium]|nr:Clp protease N-terminal domain-containing protein [Anaerolineae bacterium]HPL29685.1 Clp protease N-terminal domain-containing protein [Anaerolineae bacterium]
MNINKYTEKAQQALQTAQELASGLSHSQIDAEHVLLALLRQTDGVVPQVLSKMGVAPQAVDRALADALERRPKAYGATMQVGLSREAAELLNRAEAEASAMRDEYVSTEHILLAATAERAGDVGRTLRELGVSHDTTLRALADIRGSQRVVDQNPEAKYQALERYGRDLTQLARAGKLDPVIGRDEEIRRVIQVLSRRTKNNPVLVGEAGVGKTAIAEGLAQRIVRG